MMKLEGLDSWQYFTTSTDLISGTDHRQECKKERIWSFWSEFFFVDFCAVSALAETACLSKLVGLTGPISALCLRSL